MSFSWTDERVEMLKKLWIEGLSASQIAAELGGITRNAVIGKVHRLGLQGRVKQGINARIPRAARPRKPPQPRGYALRIAGGFAPKSITPLQLEARLQEGFAAIDASNIVAPEVKAVQRKTLLEVGSADCHWPIGDPGSADFYFCGGEAITGVSYCAYHARIAYRPAPTRERAPYIPARRAA